MENVAVRGAKTLGEKLAEHRDMVMLSRELAQIRYDVQVAKDETALSRQVPDLSALNALYDDLGFGQGLRHQARRISDSY